MILCVCGRLICLGHHTDCICRVNHGLAPGRKRAYMLYKAVLKDTATSGESTDEEGSDSPAAGTSAPHPYHMALGVLSLQKVFICCFHNQAIGNVMTFFVQYLTEDCSTSSLSEFKAMLENRYTVREQLIGDFKKKRKP